MFTTLHIPADCYNVVGWRLVLNYMWTPPTHDYLEASGQAIYKETHLKLLMIKVTLSRALCGHFLIKDLLFGWYMANLWWKPTLPKDIFYDKIGLCGFGFSWCPFRNALEIHLENILGRTFKIISWISPLHYSPLKIWRPLSHVVLSLPGVIPPLPFRGYVL